MRKYYDKSFRGAGVPTRSTAMRASVLAVISEAWALRYDGTWFRVFTGGVGVVSADNIPEL